MANETLYGCVDWATGKVQFSQTDGNVECQYCSSDSCIWLGCIEWDGVHAGQVAVTIDNDNCDDTYYGCVDWSTGEFEVSVPDNCCILGEQPDYVLVTLFGGSACGCVDPPGYNDITYSNYSPPSGQQTLPWVNNCTYTLVIEGGSFIDWVRHTSDDGSCTGEQSSGTITTCCLTVFMASAYQIRLSVGSGSCDGSFFYGRESVDPGACGNCMCRGHMFSLSNENECGVEGIRAYGGSAQIVIP